MAVQLHTFPHAHSPSGPHRARYIFSRLIRCPSENDSHIRRKIKQICKINLIPQRISFCSADGIKITANRVLNVSWKGGNDAMLLDIHCYLDMLANPTARLDHMLFIFVRLMIVFSHIYEPLSYSHLQRFSHNNQLDEGEGVRGWVNSWKMKIWFICSYNQKIDLLKKRSYRF